MIAVGDQVEVSYFDSTFIGSVVETIVKNNETTYVYVIDDDGSTKLGFPIRYVRKVK